MINQPSLDFLTAQRVKPGGLMSADHGSGGRTWLVSRPTGERPTALGGT